MSKSEDGFKRYQHVEHFGSPLVEGIEFGECFIFPKLDGTNTSFWRNDPQMIMAGSRNRIITEDKPHFDFTEEFIVPNRVNLHKLFDSCPNWLVFGEWLVPHTLKSYREGAWKQFYAFDVWDREKRRYLHYNVYATALKTLGINVIEPLKVINTPTEEQLLMAVNTNTYLVEDGCGLGEGIVIKNYGYISPLTQKLTHAKMVRNEFKEENRRSFGYAELDGKSTPEGMIVEKAITPELVKKERAKIEGVIDPADYRRQLIPRLLETVFYVLITEELYSTMSKLKLFGSTVDFKRLRGHCIAATKKYADDLF